MHVGRRQTHCVRKTNKLCATSNGQDRYSIVIFARWLIEVIGVGWGEYRCHTMVMVHFAISHFAVSPYLTLSLTPNPNPVPNYNPKP